MADQKGPKVRNAPAPAPAAFASSERTGMSSKDPNAPVPTASASSSQTGKKSRVLSEVDVPIPSGVPQIRCRLEVVKKQRVSDTEKVAWIRISFLAQMAAISLAAMSWFSIALGKMAFLWATVVLLGASIQQLPGYDFWLITALIFTEGVRVFLSSYEFKLRKSLFLRKGITWTASLSIPGFFISLVVLIFETCMLACTKVKPVYSRQILPLWSYGVLLYVLQFGSAGTSFSFSTQRLEQWDSIKLQDNPSETQKYAVLLFYVLVVAEASLFLATRMVWDVLHWLLVMQVALFKNDTAKLYLLEEFFFAVHETAVADNFIDASHMSLLSHSVSTLLLFDEPDSHGEAAQYGTSLFRQRVLYLERMPDCVDEANSRWIDCLLKLMDERFPVEIRKIAMDVLIRLLEEEARVPRPDGPTGTLMQQIAFDRRKIEALQKSMDHKEFGEEQSRISELIRNISSSLSQEEMDRMPKWPTDPEQGLNDQAPATRRGVA